MATITNNTYQNNGKTYDAKTGAEISSGAPVQSDAQRANAYAAAGVDPTIGASPVRRYTGADAGSAAAPSASPYDSAAAAYYGGTTKTPEDPAAVRARMLGNVQSLVDSIKNTYAGIISSEKQKGVERAGATRALSARSGTLGSDFGNTDKANTDVFNEQQVAARENERDSKIAAILTGVNDRADAQIEKDKITADKNSVDYLNFLKGNQETARTDATNLFKSGMSVEQLSDDEYRKLLSQTGYGPDQLKALSIINKPAEKVLTSFQNGSKYYVVSQDPITGTKKTESVDLGFKVPENYTSSKLEDGSLIFYNEKGIDPTKPIEGQILHYSPSGATDKYNAEVAKLKADAYKSYREGAAAGTIPTDLAGYTKAQQKTLSDANIKNAGGAKVFLNTEPTFQDQFIRAVATSTSTPADFTAEEIQGAYDDWVKRVAAAKEAAKKGNRQLFPTQ